MAWVPCSDCEERLKQRALDVSRQEHTSGLKILETLHDRKDQPMPGNWMRVTSHKCEHCGLNWTRTEGQSGALNQYDSTLSPKPTSEQESALSN